MTPCLALRCLSIFISCYAFANFKGFTNKIFAFCYNFHKATDFDPAAADYLLIKYQFLDNCTNTVGISASYQAHETCLRQI